MNKTPLYYLEKFSGKLLGLLIGFYFYWHPIEKFISEDVFFDKVLSFSSTLFGFLLAVLTLIIQSSSKTIENMKKNKSYSRLISYNKSIVYISGLLSLLSLIFLSINDTCLSKYYQFLLLYSSVCIGFSIALVVDTIIFLHIFYSIILNDAKQ